MSYSFVKEGYSFLEGVNLIQAKYSYYDRDKLKDTFMNKVYSVEMVKNSILSDNLFYQFLKILIFDALIGNSDRHHSNWGLITNTTLFKPTLSPIYDNGSSLCAYDEESNIKTILSDKMRFEASITSKSRSVIGFNNKRPVQHFELVKHIAELYYYQTAKIVGKIMTNVTSEVIDNILQNFDSAIISDDRKRLIKKFLLERRKIILNIYGLGEK